MDTGMIFAVIFAVIFIGFLLAYGVGQIQSLFCLTEQTNTLRAVKDLQTLSEGLYTKAEGSSDLYKLTIPENSKVCFFNPENWSGNYDHYDQDRAWDPDKYPLIPYVLGNEFTEDYGSNVWVFYCGGDLGFKIKNLFPCERVPGTINLSKEEDAWKGNFCAPPGSELFLLNRGAFVTLEINEEDENDCVR